MPRPFKKTTPTTFRDKLESQLSDLADQTDGLRKQVVARAPEVRDQIVEQAGELRQQVVDRAPVVRDQIVAALPDKDQLLDLRGDLFERLPETVQDKLPERPMPKKKRRLRKVAALGVLTGAGAAAFAILKRRGQPEHAYTPPTSTPPPTAPTTPPAPSSSSTPSSTPTSSPNGAPTAGDVVGGASDSTNGSTSKS